MDFFEQATKKINAARTDGLDTKERVMLPAVKSALADFCKQDAEFAQAVAQGGSIADCMKAVAKGVGGSISDLEVYKRAVGFFFPGATVIFQMKVDVCPNRVGQQEQEAAPTIMLDLEAFF